MLAEILDQPLSGWMKKENPQPIVLSSRIRLARNLKDYTFPPLKKEEDLIAVEKGVRRLVEKIKAADHDTYALVGMNQLSQEEREILVEKHIISPLFAEGETYQSLLVSEDASVAIMINEEDHLRIQVVEGGLDLETAWERASRIDDAIGGQWEYAFSETLGFLTACPTNVGTGLRASVMLHLPALVLTKRIDRLIRSILQLGFSVRGLYGEGTDALGHIYQVSNQVTMGISEEETIKQLKKIVEQLIDEEEKSRNQLKNDEKNWLEDKVWRSYGVLSFARRLSGNEALSLLSDVVLGTEMGILPGIKPVDFQAFLVISRPNFLSKYVKKELKSVDERDMTRAEVVRQMLSNRK